MKIRKLLFPLLAFGMGCFPALESAQLRTGAEETAWKKLPVLLDLPTEGKGSFQLPSIPEDGDELSLTVRFRERGFLKILCGKGKIEWSYTGPETYRISVWEDAEQRPVTQLNCRVRGVLQDSFSIDDNLLNWSKFYQYSIPEFTEQDMNMRICANGGQYDFHINGLYAATLKAAPVSFQFRDMEIQELSGEKNRNPDRFTTLDLTPKYNFNVGFKKDSFPERKIAEVKGIPFFFGRKWKQGNALNVGQSWSRFVNTRSEGGEFGGRWGGVWDHAAASQNNPTRFQFRVPQNDYTALHVIAASIKNTPAAIDRFTVQFYRPGAGFPKDFQSPPVPFLSAKANAESIQVDGKTLSLVTVPLDTGALKEFKDLPYLEFEITKDVLDYQCYPDPFYYSRLGGGLPSAVKIFAATLEKAPLSVDFEPGEFANVWLAPEPVFYRAGLSNHTEKSMKLKLELESVSWDGKEKTHTEREVLLPPGKSLTEKLDLKLKRYGHHFVTLKVSGDASYRQERTLSYLHARENSNPDLEDYPGFIFGVWNWGGGHYTVDGPEFYDLIGKSGFKATGFRIPDPVTEKAAYETAKKWHIRSYFAGDLWPTADYAKEMEKKKQNEEKNRRNTLAKLGLPPDTPKLENDLEQKKFFAFGTEPAFGIYTGGSLPEFYGEKALDPYGNNEEPVAGEMLNASKSQEYTRLRDGLRKNIPLLKKEHPDYKVMVPWGDPNFLIPFLSDPVLKDQIDGALYDTGVFDRMPEMQLHQTVIHRLWQFRQNWSKYVKDRDPLLVSIEGPCFTGVLNSKGALSERELASYVPRSMLLLGAYGMNRQFSLPGGSAPASYWGEQHYGNGPIGRYATLNPHVLYSTIATMIRHLEPLRFVRPLRLKEKSLYALQFEDVRDPQKKVHFIWTIRGTRPLRIGAPFSAYDLMDNPVDGKDSTITISDMPVIVYGLGADSEALLFPGEPDHSDSQNGEFVTRIANPGDGKWEQIQENDRDYTAAAVDFIRRFPAEMETSIVEVPEKYGSKALSVLLGPQEKNRGTMPHYTTFVPKQKIIIPGTAETLNIHVKGTGDWGRILFSLRDAKGEKWISCGVRNEWNCDDTKSLSSLNFEGWRLLKIPLPGNAPWDSFRLYGTASWAAYGGDERVDYPLSIEKMIVERREQFIHVNSLEKLEPQAVLIGDMFAEYPSAEAMAPRAAQAANLRMPPPSRRFKEPNPVVQLEARADKSLPKPEILSVEEPGTGNDGTNGIFHIRPIPEAVEYDFYVSRNPDGSGALLLGRNLKNAPFHIRNFKAETDLYAFLVYRSKEKKQSLPSPVFKFNMKKNFGNN